MQWPPDLFAISKKKFVVQYDNYIGEGDSKTFKAIIDLETYSDEFKTVKSECIGHAEKRMGSKYKERKEVPGKKKISR